MKFRLHLFALIFLSGIIANLSCKKEMPCEGCATKNNKPPIAVAGPDQVITLPADSVLLDGKQSSDPDGIIHSYLWTKISGPASFNISKPADSITKVKSLIAGTYQFELKVTDNVGLSSKDTMSVSVDPILTTNYPPIADAGIDRIIILPTNAVDLDGSASTDPENNITSYVWTKISGPSSFTIANSGAVQTSLTNLIQGIYRVELTVTDAGGLFSKDTTQVTVNITPPPSIDCDPINRPIVNAQLVPFGTLSEAKSRLSMATAGNKILFAGGLLSSGMASSTVDIYDLTNQSWSTAQLSVGRFLMAAISFGNKIYFAGGVISNTNYNYTLSSRIDIYDVTSNTWSIAELSEPRSDMSVATIGNKIMFAGGTKLFNCSSFCTSDRVDIYNTSTNTWSTATLSVARNGLSATAAGNKIYFAGGGDWAVGSGVYDHIDIYDDNTNSWTTSTLVERKSHHGAIAVGNYIYWAGAEVLANWNDYETTCNVERRDLSNGTSTVLHLFQPSSASNEAPHRTEALLKNGLIVFYTAGTQFDIYDPASDVWSIGVIAMTQGFDFAVAISVNNTIYITGGDPSSTPLSIVWKLEF